MIHPNALEIEDIFEIENIYRNKELDKDSTKEEINSVINKFWIKKSLEFFSCKFRNGTAKYFKKLKKQGHIVEIHTSRAHSCDKGIMGVIVRNLTKLQFAINKINIRHTDIHYYENDNEKIEGILKSNTDLLFDDKPQIIQKIKESSISVICVDGTHNQNLNSDIPRISNFEDENVTAAVEKIFGYTNLQYYNREMQSTSFFNKIKVIKPFIIKKFSPIVLNKENILINNKQGIIYAPNHQRTLDPIIITAVLCIHIHWAALLRFFEGKDSIFNNSKNPFLCRLTSFAFNKLEYFPIERRMDNDKANNFNSIKSMNNYLKIKAKIGIFPEGTTRKPSGCHFGNFDSSFILLAQKNNAAIQPITLTWIQDKNIKSKVIVNFGKPIFTNGMTLKDSMNMYMREQQVRWDENITLVDKLKNKKGSKNK